MKSPTNWFSNMIPCDRPFAVSGITYWTVENYYQGQKTLDLDLRNFLASINPYGAKTYWRKREARADWKEIRLLTMYTGLCYKFVPGSSHYFHLVHSIGKICAYNSWHDNFWGDCLCLRCRSVKGKNHLGLLLMKLREQLHAELKGGVNDD